MLSQLKNFVDSPKRKLFYHAHIFPDLTYRIYCLGRLL